MIDSSYDEETTNNDIALLKLKKKIDFKKYSGTVTPVCLPDLPRKYYGETVIQQMKQVLKFEYFDSPGDSVWLGSSFRRRKSCKETPRSWSWGIARHPHFFFSLTQAPLSDNLDETVQRRLPLQEKLDIFKDDVHFQVGYNPNLFFFFFFWKLIARQNSDACQGDSGGPLVRVNPTSGRYEQVQLASLLNFLTQNTFVNLHPSFRVNPTFGQIW